MSRSPGRGVKLYALRQGILKRRAAQAVEGRRLVVVGVITVHRPPEMGDVDAAAQSRVNRVFTEQPAVMNQPESGIQREPGGRPVLILRKQ